MGAHPSKSVESTSTDSRDEQAFYAERPVRVSGLGRLPFLQAQRFSPSLVQHLSDLPSGDSAPSSSRQSTLDEHIRQRISAEIAALKAQEQEIQEKINRALEKENLEKETSADKGIKSSTALQQELEEVARKVELHRQKRDIEKNYPEVNATRSSLIACYKKNKDRPLDCWLEAAEFRTAVKKAEQLFVESEAVKVQ